MRFFLIAVGLILTCKLSLATDTELKINGNSTFQNFLDRHQLSGHSEVLKKLEMKTNSLSSMTYKKGIITIEGNSLKPSKNPFKFTLNGKDIHLNPRDPIQKQIDVFRKYIKYPKKFTLKGLYPINSVAASDPGSGSVLGAIWGVGTVVSFFRCRNNRDFDHLTMFGCAVRGAFWPLRVLFGGMAYAGTPDEQNPILLTGITCEEPIKAEFLNSSGNIDKLEITKQGQNHSATLNRKVVGGIGGSVTFFLNQDFKTTLIQENMVGLERENREYTDDQKKPFEFMVKTVSDYCADTLTDDQKKQLDDFMRLNAQSQIEEQETAPQGSRGRNRRRNSRRQTNSENR